MPQIILYKRLHLDNISVVHICFGANYISEHSNSKVKVSIPFRHASIQATWQTATGNQRRQRVKEGHVSIVSANLPYKATWERQAEMIAVFLEPAFIAHAAYELNRGVVEIAEQWTARDPLIQQLGLALRTEFQEGLPGRIYVESVATVLAAHLLRHYSASGQPVYDLVGELPKQKLRQATEYINDNLEHEVALAKIAEVVEMSPYRFARAFKQSMGLPPHRYLLECRIERAKMLLAETDLSIAEISYRLGFSSQSHFTATFRRLMAVTPKAYREAK